MYDATGVRKVADNVSCIVYGVGRRASVPFRTGDVLIFSTLVQKSHRNAGGIQVGSDNGCAVVLDIASSSSASLAIRVIQSGELLAFENIPVRDAATVRVSPD